MTENHSDLEIIHEDGTITDKRDGIRRSYEDHIARFPLAAPQAVLPASTPAPAKHSGRISAAALAASCGAVGGAIVSIIAHAIHF